jgi:hypothetical protein
VKCIWPSLQEQGRWPPTARDTQLMRVGRETRRGVWLMEHPHSPPTTRERHGETPPKTRLSCLDLLRRGRSRQPAGPQRRRLSRLTATHASAWCSHLTRGAIWLHLQASHRTPADGAGMERSLPSPPDPIRRRRAYGVFRQLGPLGSPFARAIWLPHCPY